jgi:FkbM family methyltransferase
MCGLCIGGPAYDQASKDALKDENCVAIDVGSNTGGVAGSFCAKGYKEVHLFEPSPRMIESSKISLEKYKDKCFFNQCGVSDVPKTLRNIKLLQSWILCGDGEHYNYPVSPGALALQPEPFDANLIALDDYCKDFTRLDLLKIDVEGYEYKVLRGAEKTIQKFKPVIILELSLYIKDIEKIEIIHFINYLYAIGYDIFDLQSNPVSRERMIAEYPYHSSCDVVMYPKK